jgi:hypothetical protein
MKSVSNNRVLASLVLVSGLAGIWPGFAPLPERSALAHAAMDTGDRRVIALDVAIDCRTAAGGPNRGDVFILNGKVFPPRTLPSGAASNDPTEPVNGVAPIGEAFVRGHHALPLPPVVGQAYSSAPGDFATVYMILNGGRSTLTFESYAYLEGDIPGAVRSVVTGGIGAFNGATGELKNSILGVNVTGCPNFRNTVSIVRRARND